MSIFQGYPELLIVHTVLCRFSNELLFYNSFGWRLLYNGMKLSPFFKHLVFKNGLNDSFGSLANDNDFAHTACTNSYLRGWQFERCQLATSYCCASLCKQSTFVQSYGMNWGSRRLRQRGGAKQLPKEPIYHPLNTRMPRNDNQCYRIVSTVRQ